MGLWQLCDGRAAGRDRRGGGGRLAADVDRVDAVVVSDADLQQDGAGTAPGG
jgi:hypothetical protein